MSAQVLQAFCDRDWLIVSAGAIPGVRWVTFLAYERERATGVTWARLLWRAPDGMMTGRVLPELLREPTAAELEAMHG